MSQHKIVVYVPLENADALREAIGVAGGGKLGNYTFCSFSTKGVGRFLPQEGAHPTIGQVGKLEVVEEERIEVTVDSEILKDVIDAIKKVHPYDEIAMDVWPLQSW